MLNDAAAAGRPAYRTATWTVRQQDPGLRRIQPYLDQVHSNLLRYRPVSNSS